MHPYKSLCQQRAIRFRCCHSLLLLGLFAVLYFPLQAQQADYFDGPYIFQQTDSLQLKWIERGVPYDTTIAHADATVFQRDSLPLVNLQRLSFPTAKASTYTGIDRIIAISDVHGQYQLMRELLLSSGVIDTTNNWALGDGHLVVIGDNFDRGDEVLPILWLLFELEQQALANGGHLHLLLGNHELMVLHGDIRYLHKKYNYTAGALQTPYPELFARGSILGDWIAQHQVAVSINEHLFVHAGISPEVLKLDLSLEALNTTFRERILRQPYDAIAADPTLDLLYGGEGPLWYRGYFGNEAISKGKFKKQLKAYDQEKIIVGHTSQEDIHPLYGGKLIVIDCSIKLGVRGQVLLIENDAVYIIDQDGEQLPIVMKKHAPTTSIQEVLMASSSRPQLTIETDFQQLLKGKMEEEYQPAEISLRTADFAHTLHGRIRTRGNMRKQACELPPLLIDLRKSDLDSLEYIRHDKLKLVIPCQENSSYQTNLYKEFLIYDLYQLINDHGIQTQLVDIEIIDAKGQRQLTGFLIETERDYEHRTGAQVLQTGRVTSSVLDREYFVRMQFFQYMIANCDWALTGKHNLELVKFPDKERAEVIAYDFDYSGFVGNGYAVPAPSLPIKSVHERYFFSYPTTDEEIDQTISYFLKQETEIYATCAAADYLSVKDREKCQDYLRSFFDLLRNPKKFKRRIGR
ncbi:metallophosphoesterase [Lewinella cohaerens]|uniref:metallophosphoesterase n=1 Tax=Lewinella cohaerens TaxID=70995 RepID=UPI00146D53FE|nr:metallophosphoesterase [Lewinella cohaerens]